LIQDTRKPRLMARLFAIFPPSAGGGGEFAEICRSSGRKIIKQAAAERDLQPEDILLPLPGPGDPES
jgi:hypothetical protein